MENSVERLDRLFRHRRPDITTEVERARLLGVNPSTYSAARSRGALSKEIASKAARRLHTTADWILNGVGDDPTGVINDTQPFVVHRLIPVLNWKTPKQKHNLSDIKDGEMQGTYPIPEDLPGGPHCFILVMSDDSMVDIQGAYGKSIAKGDRLMLDPDAKIGIGDLVLADAAGASESVFRRYHLRGYDDGGEPIIDLVPLNPAYPSYTISSQKPGRLLARLVVRFDAF